MPAVSALEWDIIDARVSAAKDRYQLSGLSLAFLYLVLEQYFPDRSSDYPEMIVDGGNDLGVDAIEILEREDRAEVLIFQSKHRTSLNSTDRTINDNEVLKIGSFLHALFDKEDRLSKTGNLQLTEAVSRIWQLHRNGVICRYRVILCSNGKGLSPSAKTILESTLRSMFNVDYEVYGPAEMMRDIGATGRERETGKLQVIGREAFERTDGDIRGVIASVDARSFVEMIQTPDKRSIKRHLFDENLRIFLGANGGYNSNIIQTAVSDDSHLFWYLNNGITITCKEYAYNKSHANPVIRIEDFQIVNGAQTSHSLLEAYKRSPEAFENVVLMVRVYATARSDITERVAVATNSQARIQARDLMANHPILKKLEIAFHDQGYFFERKRNMHVDRDPRKRIDALKLGQILLSFHLGEPDRAKADSDTIFGERFNAIFHESYVVEDLCRLVEVYRLIEEMREAHLSKQRDAIEPTGEHQYLVYGHWFVLYAARLILTQKDRPLPTGDDAQRLVLEALTLVSNACANVKSAAQYQLFRSSKTKARIIAEIEGRQLSLFDL
ncbi:AIPR family protein [Sinorhizobium sp. 8-89]|uniref:AIPR family protein n=1 Tax=Sinorhizobium sp. 7-81 TaxID=3049087 RepID=UPI0024C22EE9|nr:AIPR family protein [Sinorhizobium sp. 7-81]MDK1386526.1 AIPR family protein [Sinorhizobium sp. 7-81]